MSTESVPGTNYTYTLVNFDAKGVEIPEGGSLQSDALAKTVGSPGVTDVFLFSHGWMGDVPAAKAQYGPWLAAMASCERDIERMNAARGGKFLPVMIGLHWPSLPWGDESGGDPASFAADDDAVKTVDELVDEYAKTIADTPTARAALRVIIQAADENVAPAALPPEVVEAYQTLNRESGLGGDGEAGDPGSDREPFDAEAIFENASSESYSYGGIDFSGLLSPLRTMSFWKMKDRARKFGESAGASLLARLQTVAPNAKFHLMGHSFGCIVVSAILSGGAKMVRPVDSATLAQGALSLWSYTDAIPTASGKAGYFRSIISEGRVKGPLITTQSTFDTAVGRWYPLAAGVALQVVFGAPGDLPKYGAVGTFGLQGLADKAVDTVLQDVDHDYGFQPGYVYNIESSDIIKTGGGFSGAHCDIAHPEVAHAVWEAARGNS